MSSPYMHDTSFFPQDEVEISSRLESLRVCQITGAVAKKATCIVPVAALDASGPEQPLGFDPYKDDALIALAMKNNAIIAPVIWFCPTGYTHGKPEDGTFDMDLHAFASYLENVLTTLFAIGFQSVSMVTYVDADDPARSAPLVSACEFVRANLFNDLWKDPVIGSNWWDRPDRDEVNWQRYSRHELKRPSQPDFALQPGDRPLRLEQLTPNHLRDCIAKGYPLFIPSGVLENHGNQNPIGCDGYESQDPLLRAAEQAPAVVAPTIWFGPTCYGVSGPELATTDIDGHRYHKFVEGVITGMAAMGWQNVVFVQVHQGLGGAQANATLMAIQTYRASLAFREGFGPGWAADGKTAPTNVEMITPPHGQYDHAGKNETSWMLYLRPENSDLSLIRDNDYLFCWNPGGEANLATAEWGETMCRKTVAGLIEVINKKVKG
ncbi:MAG: creatininase family protein [Planctomycetota bacterium]|nr:creatininase family protein [Planctomycetota bacterium]